MIIMSLVLNIAIHAVALFIIWKTIMIILEIISYFITTRNKFKKEGKIIAVNGICDRDTGFLSNSTVKETSLLFDNGELFTFNVTIQHIFLNKKVVLHYTKAEIIEEMKFEKLEYLEEKR